MSVMTAGRIVAWDTDRVSHADELLEALYAGQWTRMVRLAALLLRASDQAEEIAQDAFVQVYKRANRFDTADEATGYLRTCVVNGVRSAQRHRDVVRRRPPPPDAAPDGPEELAVRAETGRTVLAALDELPQRQREVLVLRYWSELSEAEIAESLGISKGAVKSHAHRGVAALRGRLNESPLNDSTLDGQAPGASAPHDPTGQEGGRP